MRNSKQDDGRPLPDAAVCQTRYLGRLLDLTECVVKNPDGCPYLLRFGDGAFCRHPDCRKFEPPSVA